MKRVPAYQTCAVSMVSAMRAYIDGAASMVQQVWWNGRIIHEPHERTVGWKPPIEEDVHWRDAGCWHCKRHNPKKLVKPALLRELAKRVPLEYQVSIRIACNELSISATAKLSDENAAIADWLERLTPAQHHNYRATQNMSFYLP